MISYFTQHKVYEKVRHYPQKSYEIEWFFEEGIKKAFKSLVAPVSALEYGTDAYVSAKTALPYITPHGVFEYRANDKIQKLSGLVLMDLDLKENKLLDVKKTRKALCKDPIVYALFSSPGGGLKFFVRYDSMPDIAKFYDYSGQVADYFEESYGFKMDRGQGKLSQPCFISYDPNLYINKESTLYEFAVIQDDVKEQTTYTGYSKGTEKQFKNKFEMAVYWCEKQSHYWVDGQKHNYLCSFASCCNKLGVAEADCVTYAKDQLGWSGKGSNAITWYYSRKANLHGTWPFVPYSEYVASKKTERATAQKIDLASFPNLDTKKATDLSFPVDAFPKAYQAIITEVSNSQDFEQNIFAFAILNAASSCIGSAATIDMGNDWEVTSNLYGALVGNPSIGKSPVIKFAYAPLMKADSLLHEQYQKDYADWVSETNKIKKGQEKPAEPVEVAKLTTDSTIESLMKMLSENPRGITVLAEELNSFFKSLTRYQSSAADSYLSLWANAWGKATRKSSKTIQINKPFVCVFGGIQNEILQIMVADSKKENGFLWRFLFCFAKDKKRRTWAELCSSPNIRNHTQMYSNMLNKIINLEGQSVLFLTKEADAIWGKWFDENGAKIDATKDNSRKDFLGKFSIICTRLCLILQIMDWSATGQMKEVTAKNVEGGIKLTEFFILQTELALSTIEKNEEKDHDKKKVGFRSKTNWKNIYGSDTQLTTAELKLRLIKEGHSERTVYRLLADELTKVKRGIYTYATATTGQN